MQPARGGAGTAEIRRPRGAIGCLRHHLEEPCKVQHASEVAVFAAWMRTERGWSEVTIQGCCATVDRFFDWLDERGVALASVGIDDIDQAVARWRTRNYSRITVHDYAQRLRTFFRFAERQCWCTPGLADGIMPSRFHRGEMLPKGLTRNEVLRLATSEGNRQTVDGATAPS